MAQSDIIETIKKRYLLKKNIKDQRKSIRDEQDNALNKMLPIYEKVSNTDGFVSARSMATVPRQDYTSVLPHLAHNFLQGTKLFADFADFTPEATIDSPERQRKATALTNVLSLVRREGDWDKANKAAVSDLIRGECYLYHDLIHSFDQKSMEKIQYSHIPWDNVLPDYGSTDWVIVSNLTDFDYIATYGQEKFDKVGLGNIIGEVQNDEINDTDNQKREEDIVQVVTYINEAKLEYYEIHGDGEEGKNVELTGDDYPFKDEDGRPFTPIKRRIFYEPLEGYHGWGVFDFLVPLARTDTSMMNASIRRAVKDADPLVMIDADDPKAEQRNYEQHMLDRDAGGFTKPMFVQNTNIGTKRLIQNK